MLRKRKTVRFYEYDLNISEALDRLQKYIDTVQFNVTHISKIDYLQAMESNAKKHCVENNISLNLLRSRFAIIVKGNSSVYSSLLGLSLISYDIHKIWDFLNYQKKIYTGNFVFEYIVKHAAYNYVKNNSPFDNEQRKAKIMDWIYELNKGNAIRPNTKDDAKLKWIKPDLKLFSKRLYNKKCFDKPLSFCNAVEKGRLAEWKNTPINLAYLIYKLEHDGYLKAAKRNGHFKAAEELFLDFLKKSNPKLRLRELSSRATLKISKSPNKPTPEKIFVADLMLNLSH